MTFYIQYCYTSMSANKQNLPWESCKNEKLCQGLNRMGEMISEKEGTHCSLRKQNGKDTKQKWNKKNIKYNFMSSYH